MRRMALILLAFSMLAFAAHAQQDVVFAVELLYSEDGSIMLENMELVKGAAPDYVIPWEEGFQAELLDFEGEEIFYMTFPISFAAYDRPRNLTEQPVLLFIPYVETSSKLNIKDADDNLLLEIDVSEYAVCNQNGICEPHLDENEILCPDDCAEDFDEYSEELPSEEEEEEAGFPLGALLLALSAIIFVGILFYIKRKRR